WYFPQVLLAPQCFELSHPASSYPVARGAADTIPSAAPTRSPRLSQVLASNRSVTPSLLPLFAAPTLPGSISKHDATNNSDVVSNNNGEKWHVKALGVFEVCVTRQF
ncbi:hypothetical protein, partial [Burkholderia cenocepacia]|uniref:hypothetical protein n=1 Tax=Burkholderia cenocepacia TaxID=95486 RepID=UPI002AB2498D